MAMTSKRPGTKAIGGWRQEFASALARWSQITLSQLAVAAVVASVAWPHSVFAAVTIEEPPSSPSKTDCASIIGAMQSRLATELIGKLAKDHKGGNIVVSPTSLAGAFVTLSLGASAHMTSALANALGIDKTDRDCAPREVLKTLDAAVADLAKESSDTVQIADRLILDPAVRPYPLLLDGLTALGREIAIDDLTKPDAVTRANDWVKDKTHGLIPAILSGPLEQPALTVLDALHFKARWAHRFDPALTKPHTFQNADGKREDVMLMHLGGGRYAIRRDMEFVAVDLPFEGERLSLTLVTTVDKPAPAASFSKTTAFLYGSGYALISAAIGLPRLKLSGTGNLLPALAAHGLDKAGRDALGGFAPDVRLSQIIQRVEMSADEDGAEAAAATAVTTSRSFEGKPLEITFDKPFVFALRDHKTGLILVAGYVADPGRPAPAVGPSQASAPGQALDTAGAHGTPADQASPPGPVAKPVGGRPASGLRP